MDGTRTRACPSSDLIVPKSAKADLGVKPGHDEVGFVGAMALIVWGDRSVCLDDSNAIEPSV